MFSEKPIDFSDGQDPITANKFSARRIRLSNKFRIVDRARCSCDGARVLWAHIGERTGTRIRERTREGLCVRARNLIGEIR